MQKLAILVLLGMALALSFALAEAEAKEAKYIGVKSCGKCHKKKKQGAQLAIWKKSNHAKAYETLGGGKARKKAAELGVSGSPQ